MYLISPAEYHELRNKAPVPSDINVSLHNESLLHDKMLQKNAKDAAWKEYGNEMGKVITSSVNQSNLVSPVNLSQTLPTKGAPTHELSFIRENVSTKMIGKVSQFYNMLKQVPGVKIDSNYITVNGSPQQGSTLDILKALVYANKYLRYEMYPLLKLIAQYSEIVPLVGNKEAQSIIAEIKSSSQTASTPLSKHKSSKLSRLDSFGDLSKEDSFASFDNTDQDRTARGEGIKKPKIKKKHWSSIFKKSKR